MGKVVAFDLPFVIFVRDSFRDPLLDEWLAARQAGGDPPYSPYAPDPRRPASFVLGSSIPIHVPPADMAAPYQVGLPGRQVDLYLLRRVTQGKQIVIVGEVLGDRTGRASFSSVECVFPTLMEDDPVDIEEFRFWEEAAVDALNQFIQHYRVLAERPLLQPITPSIIQQFRVGTLFSDDGAPHWASTVRGSGHMEGFGGAVSDDVDRAIRAAVANPGLPEFRALLLNDILSFADLREWRLVAIESGVFFESFLAGVIRAGFSRQGLDPSEIDSRFQEDDGRPHGVVHLAKAVLPEATGFAFAGRNEYRDWKEKVVDLRNELVHGRIEDVTAKQADDSRRAAIRAIKSIRENCPDLFPEGP